MGTILQLERIANKLKMQGNPLSLIGEMIYECIANRNDLEYQYLR